MRRGRALRGEGVCEVSEGDAVHGLSGDAGQAGEGNRWGGDRDAGSYARGDCDGGDAARETFVLREAAGAFGARNPGIDGGGEETQGGDAAWKPGAFERLDSAGLRMDLSGRDRAGAYDSCRVRLVQEGLLSDSEFGETERAARGAKGAGLRSMGGAGGVSSLLAAVGAVELARLDAVWIGDDWGLDLSRD